MEDVSSANVLPANEELTISQPQPAQTITAIPQQPQAQPDYTSPPAVAAPQMQDFAPVQSRPYTREAQLMNMVDDLVGTEDDEDDFSGPTSPAHYTESAPFYNMEPGSYYSKRNGSFARTTSPRDIPSNRTPELRNAPGAWQTSHSPMGRSSQRLQSVSSIWNESLLNNSSPMTPNPTGSLEISRISSGASLNKMNNGHVRVSSGASIKSSMPNQDAWSSFEPTPQVIPMNQRKDRLPSFAGPGSYGGMQSPLLFGAGGGPWSTGPRNSMSNMTPPNGQGG